MGTYYAGEESCPERNAQYSHTGADDCPGAILYVTSLWAVKVALVRIYLHILDMPLALALILSRSFSTNNLLREQAYI